MQQRAIARLQGDLPARSQSKVGVRSEEREEMLRRGPLEGGERITATSQSSDSKPQPIQRRLVWAINADEPLRALLVACVGVPHFGVARHL